jgi:DNA-binding GntR family transcriptional regulator
MHNYEFQTHGNLTHLPVAALDAISTTPAPEADASDASLAPRALYEQVAERLREQIFARRLEPGSWIDEQKLSAEFGISRTPLREALKVLAAEGLVTMKVRRGAYVTEMSRDDVTQVYHLLALLESDAAATVALRAGDEDRTALRALHERLEREKGRRDAFFASNEAFHLALLRIAGNRWAMQMVGDLRKVMKLNRHHSLFRQGRIAESLAEHRALMAAIEARELARAAALMREHFAHGLAAAA